MRAGKPYCTARTHIRYVTNTLITVTAVTAEIPVAVVVILVHVPSLLPVLLIRWTSMHSLLPVVSMRVWISARYPSPCRCRCKYRYRRVRVPAKIR